MESRVTKNVFCTYAGDESEADTTIFFISGNPGLISYYHPFLSLLAKHLAADQGEEEEKECSTPKPVSETSFRIYGCSLGGFEITEQSQNHRSSEESSSSPNGRQNKSKSNGESRELYNLEEQISFVQGKLNQLMRNISSGKKQRVILIGHSVGTYMALEILRRHRETMTESQSDGTDNTPDFDIIGGIMLFPTVMDISASPSGQKLTVWIPSYSTHTHT